MRLNSRYARANHCVDCVLLAVAQLIPGAVSCPCERQVGQHIPCSHQGCICELFFFEAPQPGCWARIFLWWHDRFSVLIASAFSGDESAASAALAAQRPFYGHRVRRHVCGHADVAPAHRRAGRRVRRGRARVERGSRWFFRQGSAWASLRAAACGSAWSLRPTPGTPCGWAAFGASSNGGRRGGRGGAAVGADPSGVGLAGGASCCPRRSSIRRPRMSSSWSRRWGGCVRVAGG